MALSARLFKYESLTERGIDNQRCLAIVPQCNKGVTSSRC